MLWREKLMIAQLVVNSLRSKKANFPAVFKKISPCHPNNSVLFTSSYSSRLICILMLFFHLNSDLPSYLFPSASSAVAYIHSSVLSYVTFYLINLTKLDEIPVWWPGNKNGPTVTHAYRKRRLKWVATLPLGNINTEAWSPGMGVGCGANNPTL
jgi:hypothetical protein